MYNNSKWFSFFHNFKMKVNKMPSLKNKKKKSPRRHQGLLTQLSTPKDGQKRSEANNESQRCNGKNVQSDGGRKEFESGLLDLPIRAQPATEDEGQ